MRVRTAVVTLVALGSMLVASYATAGNGLDSDTATIRQSPDRDYCSERLPVAEKRIRKLYQTRNIDRRGTMTTTVRGPNGSEISVAVETRVDGPRQPDSSEVETGLSDLVFNCGGDAFSDKECFVDVYLDGEEVTSMSPTTRGRVKLKCLSAGRHELRIDSVAETIYKGTIDLESDVEHVARIVERSPGDYEFEIYAEHPIPGRIPKPGPGGDRRARSVDEPAADDASPRHRKSRRRERDRARRTERREHRGDSDRTERRRRRPRGGPAENRGERGFEHRGDSQSDRRVREEFPDADRDRDRGRNDARRGDGCRAERGRKGPGRGRVCSADRRFGDEVRESRSRRDERGADRGRSDRRAPGNSGRAEDRSGQCGRSDHRGRQKKGRSDNCRADGSPRGACGVERSERGDDRDAESGPGYGRGRRHPAVGNEREECGPRDDRSAGSAEAENGREDRRARLDRGTKCGEA